MRITGDVLQNVSYFERMLLKKERVAKVEEGEETESSYSAGEITVSQLDFCKGQFLNYSHTVLKGVTSVES